MTRRSARWWALVVAVGLLAASCGSSGADDDATEAVAAPAEASSDDADADAVAAQVDAVGAETRDEILRIARTQLDGAQFNPDTVAGRDVLLWFWAPW